MWIGAGVHVLPGVNIGDNCVIGAGSVVEKTFRQVRWQLAIRVGKSRLSQNNSV